MYLWRYYWVKILKTPKKPKLKLQIQQKNTSNFCLLNIFLHVLLQVTWVKSLWSVQNPVFGSPSVFNASSTRQLSIWKTVPPSVSFYHCAVKHLFWIKHSAWVHYQKEISINWKNNNFHWIQGWATFDEDGAMNTGTMVTLGALGTLICLVLIIVIAFFSHR